MSGSGSRTRPMKRAILRISSSVSWVIPDLQMWEGVKGQSVKSAGVFDKQAKNLGKRADRTARGGLH